MEMEAVLKVDGRLSVSMQMHLFHHIYGHKKIQKKMREIASLEVKEQVVETEEVEEGMVGEMEEMVETELEQMVEETDVEVKMAKEEETANMEKVGNMVMDTTQMKME